MAGKETADIDDIYAKRVKADLRDGQTIEGIVIGLDSDYQTSGRICGAWLMPSGQDRSLDRHVSFDEVREFEVIG